MTIKMRGLFAFHVAHPKASRARQSEFVGVLPSTESDLRHFGPPLCGTSRLLQTGCAVDHLDRLFPLMSRGRVIQQASLLCDIGAADLRRDKCALDQAVMRCFSHWRGASLVAPWFSPLSAAY